MAITEKDVEVEMQWLKEQAEENMKVYRGTHNEANRWAADCLLDAIDHLKTHLLPKATREKHKER